VCACHVCKNAVVLVSVFRTNGRWSRDMFCFVSQESVMYSNIQHLHKWIAMTRLIRVPWTLGWKLTEIICAHTLVFDLAESTGFHDKAKPNPPAGASIAICRFCSRRRPFYVLTSFPSLARSYSTEMTCSPTKPFKPDKWLGNAVNFRAVCFPPIDADLLLGGFCGVAVVILDVDRGGV